MKLQYILLKVNVVKIVGDKNKEITNINFNSKKITKNGLFVAIRGLVADGHDYIDNSIKSGASVIFAEILPEKLHKDITYICVKNTHRSLSQLASIFYNYPSKSIRLIGVTGTNGKTTIVSLLHQLFTLLNKKSGMISTIENKIIDKVIPSTHTTPDPLQINSLLSKMVDAECEYCFMEVSSHALHQERVSDLSFNGGVFTNITNDHLDYHTTFSEYRDVKKSFFDSLSTDAFALVNKDDKNSTKMLETTKANKLTYALKSMADFSCKVIEGHFDGMSLMINKSSVWVKLIGDFNAYNLLSVFAVAKQYRFADSDILTALSMLDSADGRLQFLKNQNSIIGIVDYAHTEDALKNALITIKKLKKNSQKLVTIIGCGGNRDKSKRPTMAKVACEYSSIVILTSDNPRFEDPDLIISDMLSELNANQKEKILSINNRRQAIMTAGKLVANNDIIFLAGKGHEKYQEIKGKKLPFDDVIELKKSLNII